MNKSKVINSTDIFRKGEPDEKLTARAKKKGWIIVTRDIRMALRSLIDGVPIIFINDDDYINNILLEYSITIMEKMFKKMSCRTTNNLITETK